MIEIDASELQESLREMLSRVEDSVSESALRTIGYAGAEIFRDQAKQNSLANKKTGMLFDNIIVKRLEEDSDSGRRQSYMITVRNGTASSPGAFYWRFVEKGHKFVPKNKKVSKKTGKTIGWKAHRQAAQLVADLEFGNKRTRAYPFMRPAYDSKKREAIDVMTRTLAEQIARNAT
ncbi:HK97 gp10 family phage protein [Oxalobacteraceae sp. CFBP 13730]|nr:HK97 gp10 family phage protein [Oxalobacteraceae sp. CFBP 13730]